MVGCFHNAAAIRLAMHITIAQGGAGLTKNPDRGSTQIVSL
jgi:hypothetical protein